ncbi:bifunctional adenosylcobinamide kinase/adenosylcobinamide-phosphate guanylyltransferase [Psychrosphaera sp. B3R10]|uniref:bifunctional adenosylcobinamide kinase/adenosylcobinamide-phosphate guanylyltransferase n=1 Tax=unclassified Psychrosphaera TaxID=2641570 RepID=UPI001C09CBB4|nr:MULTISPECIES: bifunctional adenosylcobinamide kinase/adenosylcobinamide-phosphate guanylyltransferase [unclassified Psychrosphaera]MBU2880625.1 bifunctional adenosylcobinamide kinase/adenosylcobinamide-phosphate guanylyltransferase [Psychrosphaera sp. I2R16]MBU2990711.1 bifunctional adenosylcobinamide kinase/adenosylcobinamide-phosphate guanylyltransferase [Psychrosphaera sp. B3R10]
MMGPNSIHFILGGARSGKSRFAENAAARSGKNVIYIATAEGLDDEMIDRIAHHKNHRPASWAVIESPLQLADTIEQNATEHTCIIVDCLTLYLTNWLCKDNDAAWQNEKQRLLSVLENAAHNKFLVVLVSNEVGQGIVPLGELSRTFVDQAGWLHQDIARLAGKVDFIVAGLNMRLKPQKGEQ